MKFRFIEYDSVIYLVRGIGYNNQYDPPEVFYCVPLEHSVYRSLLSLYEIEIPIFQALEITDRKRLLVIWALFGR